MIERMIEEISRMMGGWMDGMMDRIIKWQNDIYRTRQTDRTTERYIDSQSLVWLYQVRAKGRQTDIGLCQVRVLRSAGAEVTLNYHWTRAAQLEILPVWESGFQYRGNTTRSSLTLQRPLVVKWHHNNAQLLFYSTLADCQHLLKDLYFSGSIVKMLFEVWEGTCNSRSTERWWGLLGICQTSLPQHERHTHTYVHVALTNTIRVCGTVTEHTERPPHSRGTGLQKAPLPWLPQTLDTRPAAFWRENSLGKKKLLCTFIFFVLKRGEEKISFQLWGGSKQDIFSPLHYCL